MYVHAIVILHGLHSLLLNTPSVFVGGLAGDKCVVQVQCCFMSTETISAIRGGHLDFHTASEL